MDTKAADQILALVTKWQEKGHWLIAYGAADSFRDYRQKSTDNFAIANRMQDAGQQGEMQESFWHDAERFGQLSEDSHRHVIAAHQEFCDLSNLLRSHAPMLLECVPLVNFFDPPDDDLPARLRDLQKLEGAVRAIVGPPAEPRPATRAEKTEAVHARVVELCNEKNLRGKWAELRDVVNADPVIQHNRDGKPLTRENCQKIVERKAPKRRKARTTARTRD